MLACKYHIELSHQYWIEWGCTTNYNAVANTVLWFDLFQSQTYQIHETPYDNLHERLNNRFVFEIYLATPHHHHQDKLYTARGILQARFAYF